MTKSILITICSILLLAVSAAGQARIPFTNGNTTVVTIEGNKEKYEYASPELLVRYNQNTQNMECVLNVASLRPLNLTAPPALAQEVFFVSKFPEFILEFKVPAERVASERPGVQVLDCRTSITFQGTTNETVIPVHFSSDKQTLVFSTNFDLMIDNFQGSVPAEYLPLLTGRIIIRIENARWASLNPN